MPSPQINAEPFSGRVDFARVMATLPEETLLSLLSDKSRKHDQEWLEAALHAGVLDAKPFFTPENKLTNYIFTPWESHGAWLARCSAFLRCMVGGTLTEHSGDATKPLLAVFEMESDIKDFFEHACDLIAKQCKAWSTEYPETDTQYTHLGMAECMALACLMDRPALLHRLAIAFSEHTDKQFNESALGGLFSCQFDDKDQEMMVGPLFCAMEFSRTDCVKILLDEVVEQDPEIYTYGSSAYALLTSMQHLSHRCKPEAMAILISHVVHDKPDYGRDSDALGIALEIMDPKTEHHRNSHMAPAFLLAGVLDEKPIRAINQALTFGHECVIEYFKSRFPWDEAIKRSGKGLWRPMLEAVARGHKAALTAVLDQAKRDGRMNVVLRGFVVPSEDQISRVATMALIEVALGQQILPRLLESGFDPLMPVKQTGQSFKDFADKQDTPARDILRSFMAQAAAISALEQVD